jgi:hypothetical protein
MRPFLSLLILTPLIHAGDPLPEKLAAHAAFAPQVQAKLLFFSVVGGAGDQWFGAVQMKGDKAQAVMGKGKLGLSVTVKPDDSVVAKVGGDRNATDVVLRDLPNGGKTGPYTFGYKQVHPILQQPFLSGGGLNLWGWTYDQAKNAKVRYAPAMADSRIKALWMTPKQSLLAVGYCDGGNTILRAHPRDCDKTLETAFDAGGGGGGKSSWLIELRPSDGEPLHIVACRGTVVCHAYDAWNRLVVGGQAVLKTGQGTAFGYQDGAGLLMTDYGWSGPLLAAHLGAKEGEKVGGMAWAIDIDSDSGLMAVGGTMEGSPQGVNAVQETNGGGRDAFLAVIRLWTSADAAIAKDREAEARKAK